MKKWLARKLFDIAIWLDWDEAVIVSEAMSVTRFKIALDALTAPRKVGRPLGSKDKAPRKRQVKP
jgi:L-ribulose-5-phosphate 3-epimerase UlaE